MNNVIALGNQIAEALRCESDVIGSDHVIHTPNGPIRITSDIHDTSYPAGRWLCTIETNGSFTTLYAQHQPKHIFDVCGVPQGELTRITEDMLDHVKYLAFSDDPDIRRPRQTATV